MYRVSVLIPHHANKTLLRPLFSSLQKMETRRNDVQFVLVDNASNDGSRDLVRREFPEVTILEMTQNLGFAPALNIAARHCEAEWLCFLNNDIRVDPDWLTNLLYAAKQHNASCLASHILNWDATQTTFAGGWINLFGKGFEDTSLQHNQPYEIFFPCGCGTLIRRDVFLEAGGFDEDYFMIYEDVDLGWRLRILGHSVFLAPDAFLMHREHASLNQLPYAQKAVYYERNSLATLYKNLDAASLGFLLPLALEELTWRAKAVGGMGVGVRYNSDGLSMLDAARDFYEKLPRWRGKREWLQTRRKVSDREIFSRFFPSPTQVWGFNKEQYARMAIPTVQREIHALFERAAEVLKV